MNAVYGRVCKGLFWVHTLKLYLDLLGTLSLHLHALVLLVVVVMVRAPLFLVISLRFI